MVLFSIQMYEKFMINLSHFCNDFLLSFFWLGFVYVLGFFYSYKIHL